DHFHSPVNDRTSWDGFHGMWPAMIVQALSRQLPANYYALPTVHLGSLAEIDIGTFENDELTTWDSGDQTDHGGVATAFWSPPQPTLSVATDSPDLAEYEVRI